MTTVKIVGYARISVDLEEDKRDNTSIENQKRIIRDFVKKEFPDAELNIYEDRDRSGYTFSQRENYQKMRKLLLSGEVRILVVKDFSRFSRRNSLGLLELETLRDAGVRIISIGDSIDYPTRDDWMLIQFKFLMNEMPVTDTSKKIRQMIDNRQKNGQWICAVPYGYRITNTREMTYEIDPPAAETVREVFRLYNIGWGYKKIANRLTDEGVPTPRANEIAAKEAEGKATRLRAKSEWSIVTIQAILRNDFYIGTLRQRKYSRKGINGQDIKLDEGDNIVIENAHEPIVDIKTFEYAQKQLELRSATHYRGEKKYATDYSGFLFCGDCGSPMFSMSRPDLAAAYTCGTYHKRGLKGCTSHHIRVDALDDFLKTFIRLLKENCQSMIDEWQKAIDEQPEREEQLGATLSDIEVRLNEARAKLKVIYKEKTLIESGFSDTRSRTKAALYDEMEEELLETVDRLEKQFGDLNSMRNTMIETNRRAKTVIEVFDDILKKEKLDKRDIGLIVERITVFEDHLNVKLKSDVDTLLSLIREEHTVNFNSDSKDISSVAVKSKNHRDKVFTVNIINNGDPLEIFTEKDGEVIFKKYSPVGEIGAIAGDCAESLHKAADVSVIICDKDTVVASSGVPKKEYNDRHITPEFEKLCGKRDIYTHDKDKLYPVDGCSKYVACAAPIICDGDIIGVVASLSGEDQANPGCDTDKKLCSTAANFIASQIN
ncbi:MAG: recombinase family protein [Clostridia bacterium]|nr:recombinase family protein [Clostridia bacterium]